MSRVEVIYYGKNVVIKKLSIVSDVKIEKNLYKLGHDKMIFSLAVAHASHAHRIKPFLIKLAREVLLCHS